MGKYQPKHQAPPTNWWEALLHLFDQPVLTARRDTLAVEGSGLGHAPVSHLSQFGILEDNIEQSEYAKPSRRIR